MKKDKIQWDERLHAAPSSCGLMMKKDKIQSHRQCVERLESCGLMMKKDKIQFTNELEQHHIVVV